MKAAYVPCLVKEDDRSRLSESLARSSGGSHVCLSLVCKSLSATSAVRLMKDVSKRSAVVVTMRVLCLSIAVTAQVWTYDVGNDGWVHGVSAWGVAYW